MAERGTWIQGKDGRLRAKGEEEPEIRLPSTELKEIEIPNVVRGKWSQDSTTGELVPYVEKPKPVAPHIIFDYCEPFISHHNGQVYTSKKKYRADLKRDGFTEVGNDIEAANKLAEKIDRDKDEAYQRQLQDDIEKAINDVKYGEAPLSELDKEVAKRRNEARAKDGT
jgi:hypothetical protein